MKAYVYFFDQYTNKGTLNFILYNSALILFSQFFFNSIDYINPNHNQATRCTYTYISFFICSLAFFMLFSDRWNNNKVSLLYCFYTINIISTIFLSIQNAKCGASMSAICINIKTYFISNIKTYLL